MGDATTRRHGDRDETLEALAELREAFGVTTTSAVLRRALGLARVIAREAQDDHTITVEAKDGSPLRLILNA